MSTNSFVWWLVLQKKIKLLEDELNAVFLTAERRVLLEKKLSKLEGIFTKIDEATEFELFTVVKEESKNG